MDNVRPLRGKKKRAKRPRRDPRALRRVIIALVVVAVVLVLVFGSRVLGMYVDWLWFGEVGFRQVFWTRIWAQLLLGAVAFAVFLAVVWGNVELARRLAPDFRADMDGSLLEPRSPAVRRWVAVGGAVVCVIAAFLAGLAASGAWQKFLLYFNQAPWGETDAQFGRDLSFYVFSMPMWQGVLDFVLAALITSLVFAAITHAVMGGLEIRQRPGRADDAPETGWSRFGRVQQAPQVPQVSLRLGGRAVAHLSVLLAAVFVVVGVGQLFRGWDLVYSEAGAVYGAGATDVAVRLPLTYVTMAIALLLAAVLVWNVWRRRQWWPLAVAVWIVALIVLRGIVPAAYQSLVVNPNQLSKERDYLARNLAATRQAYDLAEITKRPLTQSTRLTVGALNENEVTLRNIRLWDPDTLRTSYRQLQELRPYYSFLDVDVDRYMVDGVYRQTMLSARELSIDGLPEQAQTWVNQHITYTHGFGVAMSAVNQVTADGSPDFLVQDVPPRSAGGLEITEPRIYYGEKGTDYTLVKTTEQEFDYPGRDGDDVYRSYTGDGGIPVSPLLTRLAFAVRFGTIKFFTTSAFTDESRIIIRNNISERVQKVAPFLHQDADPYMVIASGRLWWVVDTYTTTDRYPYSTPEGELNYVRNAVKVVVDAYNGSMRFYIADSDDPIIKTYAKVFPDLFEPMETMPRALIEHVRYPEDLFNVQASVYATYHVSSPDVLYNKGDQWAIPEDVGAQSGRMPAYYVIMRLPGEEREEFLQILPFVPNGRRNMIAWLGAQSDVPDYGNIVNYQFSRSTTVVGPNQVQGFIQQDPEISQQRSLWDQQGSNVILGNLLVVPIDDSLLYVQPLYLEAEDNRLPQAKRVIVFYRSPGAENDPNAMQVVAMRNTLGEALAAAFGDGVDEGIAEGDGEVPDGGEGETGAGEEAGGDAGAGTGAGLSAEARALVTRANQEFDAAQEALRAGDFAEYGRRVEALEQALTDLQRLQQQ